MPWDYGNGTRLTKFDARYVQCVHTSAGTLGTLENCGHADFYINGGSEQPGCSGLMCSHSRAVEYFVESMSAEHVFSGTRCDSSLGDFISNLLGFGMQCSTDTDRLGIHSAKSPGRYFLDTNSKSPFAKQVTLIIDSLKPFDFLELLGF